MEGDIEFWVKFLGGVMVTINGIVGWFVIKAKNSVNREDQFRDDILQELGNLREENREIKAKYEASLSQIAELKLQFAMLEKEWTLKIEMFESAHNDLPVPMWLKDEKGKMLSLNGAYEQTFLLPRGFSKDDYIGKYDSDVWPADTAVSWEANDLYVYTTGETWNGTEVVPDKDDNPIVWRITKFVRKANGIKLGIGGIAVPKLEEEEK